MKSRFLPQLDVFFTIPPEAGVAPEVARHFRRNFLVNSVDGMLWYFGDSFVSLRTIVPVYASTLTSSPLIIGMIPAIADAGWFLPQLLMAPLVERLPRRLPLVRVLAALERLPFLAMAIAALWLSTLPRQTAIGIFMALLAWRALGSGVVAVPWQELVATVIPVTHRGRFFGFSNLAGQLLGMLGAAISALILARLPYPRNYAVTFLAGFIGVIASWLALIMTIEPKVERHAPPESGNRAYLVQWRRILRKNHNFRIFLINRALAAMGGMAAGFLAVYAVQRFNLPDTQAALFTAILAGSGMVGYAVWGTVGDQVGHRVVLAFATGFWSLALIVALLAPSVLVFYVVFALMGFSSAGGVIGDLNITMEFGPEAERPTYIGLARTVVGPVILIAPLLGGAIVGWTGYPAMFGVSLAFTVLSLVLLLLGVSEPRYASNAVAGNSVR